ncbi:MAG TPA: hypothetical protein GX506_11715 [Firmicutes bacterium]|nr:hypothetical protein [Bacillota bacterium]
MRFIADLHIHSHYSRATSKDCTPEGLCRWAAYKGIALLGTGDFTHPAWREELKRKLRPAGDGVYQLETSCRKATGSKATGDDIPWAGNAPVWFVVSGEISTIYRKNGRTRKLHNLLILPDLEAADRLAGRLEQLGDLGVDGRPVLSLDSYDLLKMALDVCPSVIFVPAHIWTPHFSVFGAHSGFDSIDECYEDLVGHIYTVETGLSSDPPMNWRLSALDRFALTSNSDAHSPGNLGREANIFDTEMSFTAIRDALVKRDPARFIGTLEFYPEEGKYHYDGHRACGIRWKPSETRARGGICPVCGRRVTVGVLHRVEELADRPEGARPAAARHFESLIPLVKIIASALDVGESTKRVRNHYMTMLRELGPELTILRDTPIADIERVAGPTISEGILRARRGEVNILPGFDGEYGKIDVLPDR